MDHRAMLLLLLLSALCNACTAEDLITDEEDVNTEKEDISTTILRMNNGSNDMLLEGDIFVPKTRNAMKCLNQQYSCRWDKASNGNVEIPYVISNDYDHTERNEILRAMKGFQDKTCIRFVPRRQERAYLSLEPNFGCFSVVGRSGDRQVVSLQKSGCVHYGIIQHELLHALGFLHEHTRSDRDQYVRINWDNIQTHYVNNFVKKDTENLTPYDYSSVMHYGKTAFGKMGAETITPIPNPNIPLGQREGMNDSDILRVNKLYKCWSYMG
ncbi:low choriolytic enzyme-like [Cyprinodon tularosa]|uniref:low choriolytic enzyme-like n=1 Tax=Cyprinodon tularosa TaxID=77115 RepID=UPI0018E271C1|nr:low choriolytic enzyme-like [Cyprinodon tularosa]